MKIIFDDDEISSIEQMADIAGIDSGDLRRQYMSCLEANFYEDLKSAITDIKETE